MSRTSKIIYKKQNLKNLQHIQHKLFPEVINNAPEILKFVLQNLLAQWVRFKLMQTFENYNIIKCIFGETDNKEENNVVANLRFRKLYYVKSANQLCKCTITLIM